MKSAKFIIWFVVFCFYSLPMLAFDYSNTELNFKAKLPDGLDDFSAKMQVKALICRGKMGKLGIIESISIQDLLGPVIPEELAKMATQQTNVTLEKIRWQGIDIYVFRVAEDVGGVSYVTFNAAIPLDPHAIDISVLGREANEHKLRAHLQSIVASIEGSPSRGLRLRPPRNGTAIAIGLFALIIGKLRISKNYGLGGTGARVAGLIILAVGIALPKALAPWLASIPVHGIGGLIWFSLGWIVFNCFFIGVLIAVMVNSFGNAYACIPDANASAAKKPTAKGAVTKETPDVVVQPTKLAPQAEPMSPAQCHMCNKPVPPELQKTARSCPICGADFTSLSHHRNLKPTADHRKQDQPSVANEKPDVVVQPTTLAPQAEPMSPALCQTCRKPVPPELQKTARSCPNCGADFTPQTRTGSPSIVKAETLSMKENRKTSSGFLIPNTLNRRRYFGRSLLIVILVALLLMAVHGHVDLNSAGEFSLLIAGSLLFACVKVIWLDLPRIRSIGWSPTLELLILFPVVSGALQVPMYGNGQIALFFLGMVMYGIFQMLLFVMPQVGESRTGEIGKNAPVRKDAAAKGAVANEKPDVVVQPTTLAPQAEPMSPSQCHMCNKPIPPELQTTSKSCPNCGADFMRRRR